MSTLYVGFSLSKPLRFFTIICTKSREMEMKFMKWQQIARELDTNLRKCHCYRNTKTLSQTRTQNINTNNNNNNINLF